jgi:arginyl-tRNA synthetase
MTLQELKTNTAAVVAKTFDDKLDLERLGVTYADTQFGDFATNAAMVFAKDLDQSPRQVAEALAPRIRDGLEGVERVEVAGPGFINITMKPEYWVRELERITPDYARSTIGGGRKVQVEYISANPTGPTTIGNARGGFIGEVLSRVLDRAGFDVTREYYFNNAGTQITKLLESVRMEAGLLPETEERQYRGTIS